jgi:hypothetical protein
MRLEFPEVNKKVDLQILIKKIPVRISQVYDYYWIFAKKRQDLFFERATGGSCPWTDDPILNTYKFTNAYRASDRVSQYLIRNVIYNGNDSAKEVFFRTILFKIFNKIETWELLRETFKEISLKNYSFDKYDKVLSKAMSEGQSIYSAAYIMPSRGIPSIHKKKHRMHLELVEKMLYDGLHNKIVEAKSLSEVYQLLLTYPGIGKFLAFQYAIDLNYSELINFEEMDFVVAGPGARNGIIKCFNDKAGFSDEDIIKYVAENQAAEFERLGLEFKSLWGRPLQLIDCQNLFCEVDKYSRVKFPDFSIRTGRSRIKQKFQMNIKKIDYWYPPKWGINSVINNGAE